MPKKPKCYYHVLHPDDDAQEQLDIYKKLYPDCDVYFKPAALTMLNSHSQKQTIRLMVIVCEEV